MENFNFCLIFIFGVIIASTSATLVQLNFMFRHGARTPLDVTYPNDPYSDYQYPPYGRGMLTKTGKQEAYLLGSQIRLRYETFLGKHYKSSKFNLFADASGRVQETGLIAMASLWIPSFGEQFVPDLKWQPVSYQFRIYYPFANESESKKYLGLSKDPDFWKDRLQPFQQNISFILEKAGTDDLWDIQYIYATIDPQARENLKLPDWASEVYPEPLSTITYQLFAASVFTKDLRRDGGCRDLMEMVSNMKEFIVNNSSEAMFYAAHDINVVIVLECMNITAPPSPGFAANVALELHKNEDHFAVRVMYQRILREKAKVLTVPGCSELCPFEQFKELINAHDN